MKRLIERESGKSGLGDPLDNGAKLMELVNTRLLFKIAKGVRNDEYLGPSGMEPGDIGELYLDEEGGRHLLLIGKGRPGFFSWDTDIEAKLYSVQDVLKNISISY